MSKQIIIDTHSWFSTQRFEKMEKFLTTVCRGHAVPEWNGEDIWILVKEILEHQDLDQMLSKKHERKDFIQALAVLESILQVESQVLENLFPIDIKIKWTRTGRQKETPIINGQAYKEYWVKSTTKDKKCTRFLKLDWDEIFYGKIIEVSKNHKFNNDEILESFMKI